MARLNFACAVCGAVRESQQALAEHVELIARRRTRFSGSWGMSKTMFYRPIIDAAVIAGQHDQDDQEGDLSAAQ
jgi:hypothetical protein